MGSMGYFILHNLPSLSIFQLSSSKGSQNWASKHIYLTIKVLSSGKVFLSFTTAASLEPTM